VGAAFSILHYKAEIFPVRARSKSPVFRLPFNKKVTKGFKVYLALDGVLKVYLRKNKTYLSA
jgi:hypothetical protein